MKPINQTKDFSVCLNGWTLPKYAIYGNVYGTLYVCLNATVKNGGYNILVWHNATQKKPARWESTTTREYGAIYVRIRDFVKSAEYVNEHVIFCHAHNRDEMALRAKRAEERRVRAKQRAERERAKYLRDAGAPREKRAQAEYIFRCKPQGGSLEHEYTSCMDLNKIGYIGAEAMCGRVDFGKSYFEQGQNTAGTLGRYTRSGFETRDGMKTRFADYHGQKQERPTISDPYRVKKDEKTGKHYRTYNGVRIEE